MILAPLRGVTTRTFRRVFASALAECGFDEAVTPFIAANPGTDPLKDPELRPGPPEPAFLELTPQFIGKDPRALRESLKRIKDAGYRHADLNCGCPFPMVRKKGRGSGLLRTPGVLERMLEAGCETMGPGCFSVKTRLGLDGNSELLSLMPVFNRYPLRRLAVHARNARQMYSGECDWAAFAEVARVAKMPVVRNGDIPVAPGAPGGAADMAGRGFVRHLASRPDAAELLDAYITESCREFSGPAPVLGRIKELLSYWRCEPAWARVWPVAKMASSVEELRFACGIGARKTGGNSAPVGFFDSGVGGTCILDAFRALSPCESTVYLADSANCPYGNRPPEEIIAISEKNVEWLLSKGCKAVVVACNTATAAAIDVLRARRPGIPFIGIEPAVKPAALGSKTGIVGVLATAGTFNGRLYRETKARFAGDITVMAAVADEFVGLVERGETSGPAAEAVVRRKIEPLAAAGCDMIVLGCTHFPHLRPLIEKVLAGRAQVVDPSQAVARQIARVLAERGIAAPPGNVPSHEFARTGAF